jgi:hypothetical protein
LEFDFHQLVSAISLVLITRKKKGNRESKKKGSYSKFRLHF